ncbi:hypothetical protein VA7868_02527 [Vibrio aerogenes CECT 7868]|uniref:NfeD-like C-terminal domain-containing protein n=1 Tax=Vibrio aerogenes CECT 7868 TaxID=1216006 RepID=A0A1M5ZBP3_9VIBR|nr:activity regulator of membrane protease YbbK [Vibrio aerogenes]SHI21641.1 hypothetical protein VA7868_02527 [Vibrio aerogenes CECT 7868]
MVWVIAHFPEVLMTLGVLLLVIEVAVFGFATFILFFIGLAVFLTGLMMQFGWLDVTMNAALWSSALLSLGLALILWKPLHLLQNRASSQSSQSDFAQLTFRLSGDVDMASDDVVYPYSGINWKVRSEKPLKQGQIVRVVKTEVSIFWVEAVEADDAGQSEG